MLAAAAIVAALAIVQLSGGLGAGGGPTPQQARAVADEASAIQSLRAIHAAQQQHALREGAYAPSLEVLAAKGLLLDPSLAGGRKAGYAFAVREAGAGGYFAVALPEAPGKTGGRAFAVDASGAIRFTSDGSEPHAESALLGQ